MDAENCVEQPRRLKCKVTQDGQFSALCVGGVGGVANIRMSLGSEVGTKPERQNRLILCSHCGLFETVRVLRHASF